MKISGTFLVLICPSSVVLRHLQLLTLNSILISHKLVDDFVTFHVNWFK